ncbi:MAG: class I SAM-dependent methyltransferase [Candidatus Limnocylindrales bacterium]
MTSSTPARANAPAATPDALGQKVFASILGTLDVFAIYVGDRLGYYEQLAGHGPLTSAELAERSGTVERYTREWLELQAVSGYVEASDDEPRRFSIPEGHAEALTDHLSLSYVAPFARMISAAGMKLPDIVEVHRSGDGVSWEAFGHDMRESQGDMNRPFFLSLLAKDWFGSIEDIDRRLAAGARVADIGCGLGWSAIALAQGYDGVTVDGYDLDVPSVEAATRHAVEQGVSDRVRFHAVDAGDEAVDGKYDLVTAFECIHDMPDPISALRTMKRLAGDDGIVVVMDEKVSESFSPDADEVEHLMYGFSNFICLPDGMSHGHSAGTGTVMRPDTLRGYARQAGFDDIEILPIETDFWRFYRLL